MVITNGKKRKKGFSQFHHSILYLQRRILDSCDYKYHTLCPLQIFIIFPRPRTMNTQEQIVLQLLKEHDEAVAPLVERFIHHQGEEDFFFQFVKSMMVPFWASATNPMLKDCPPELLTGIKVDMVKGFIETIIRNKTPESKLAARSLYSVTEGEKEEDIPRLVTEEFVSLIKPALMQQFSEQFDVCFKVAIGSGKDTKALLEFMKKYAF